MENVQTWCFTPSSEYYNARILVEAENESGALNLLQIIGYTDDEMTEDYSMSDYADCYQLKNIKAFVGEASQPPVTCPIVSVDGVRFIIDGVGASKEDFINYVKEDFYYDYSDFLSKVSTGTTQH